VLVFYVFVLRNVMYVDDPIGENEGVRGVPTFSLFVFVLLRFLLSMVTLFFRI
jgi:hypothetical protein